MREDSVTAGNLEKAAHRNGSRICEDLVRLKQHIESVENVQNHRKACVVCVEMAYSVCSMCGNKAMHFFPKKGIATERTALWITTKRFFGLALDDTTLVNKQKSEWTPHNIMKRRNNERHIKSLRAQQPDNV